MCLSPPTKPFVPPTERDLLGPCTYREIAGWDADGNVIELDPPAETIIVSPRRRAARPARNSLYDSVQK